MPVLHDHIEGKYEILGKIREGGMGAIYKVRHRLLDEVRVVKVLIPRLVDSKELNDRFAREARVAIQLRHPNIAQLHDFSIAEDGTAFIVMEFIDGATLEEILAQSGPPPLGLGLEIGRQSLRALGFLHRKGLLHRDISPDNLMLTRDPEGEPLVKLIDLGITKILRGDGAGLTSTGLFMGKPRYASPEQFSAAGLEGMDSRSDLYSFGVVLYQLLTGVCPVQGRDPSSLMAGHLFRPPVDFAESDPRGRLPPDLREILLRLLAKSPDERFSTAEEASRSLGEVQARYPVAPGDLDAALPPGTEFAPGLLPPPGSTQEKLNQQFAPAPTPAPTERGGRGSEATMVIPVAAALPPEIPPPPVVLPPLPVVVPPSPPAVSPPPASVSAAPRPSGRRGPLRVAAALLLLLAVVGLGIWWRLRPSSPPPPVPQDEETGPAVSPAIVLSQAEPVETAAPVESEPAAEPAPLPPPPPPEIREDPKPAADPPKRAVEREPAPAAAAAPERERKTPEPRPKPEAPAPAKRAERAAPDVTLKGDDLEVDDTVDLEPAQVVSVPTPLYPEMAQGSGSYARVIIAVLVDESGAVAATRVKTAYVEEGARTGVGASGSLTPAFQEAALAAARKARFEPALRNGKPAKMWGELVFEFGKQGGS